MKSVSLTTFSHKLCICSMINSCQLFLHKVNTQHYCVQRRRTHSNHVFQWKSLLRVLCPKGIDRDAMWFQTLGTILDWLAGWLAGYVAQIASFSCANVFLAASSWRHPFLSCAISTIKKILPGIECREVRIKLCTSLETAISRFSLLANDNSQKIHVIMPMIGNKEDSIWCSSLNVLFNGWSLVHQVISFLNCFF